jgi:signal transduction histidine kinase
MTVAASTTLILGAVVAERRRDAEVLRAMRDELEVAVRVRDEFLSMASHELKTPLTTLQLQTQALLNGRGSASPEKRLAAIDRQVVRITRLVHDMLGVSRIRAGRLELDLNDVDLVALLREALVTFEHEIERSHSSVTLEGEAEMVGRWDRTRLEQVVSNLLSNALKYGGGAPIVLSVAATDDGARLTVQDRGMGIRAADQERIFARFERAAEVRNIGGFGVGLWIVSEIVRAHRGSIRVVSEPGAGAAFIVELPRDASNAE